MTEAGMKLHFANAEEMQDFGAKIGAALQVGDVVKLYGSLGTGKTTIARGILRGAGYTEEVPSPSFSIVQYYAPPDTKLPLVHADFYRVENTDELYELGLDDAGMDGAILAEWPEKAGHVLGEESLALHLEFAGDGGRDMIIEDSQGWSNRKIWN